MRLGCTRISILQAFVGRNGSIAHIIWMNRVPLEQAILYGVSKMYKIETSTYPRIEYHSSEKGR